jgi:hypothetical protein
MTDSLCPTCGAYWTCDYEAPPSKPSPTVDAIQHGSWHNTHNWAEGLAFAEGSTEEELDAVIERFQHSDEAIALFYARVKQVRFGAR